MASESYTLKLEIGPCSSESEVIGSLASVIRQLTRAHYQTDTKVITYKLTKKY